MTDVQVGGRAVPLLAPTPTHFRSVMALVPTTVAVVAGLDRDGRPAGLTVGTVASVSLDPALVSFCIKNDSLSWPRIREAGSVGISILGHTQADVSGAFARSGGDKFSGVSWSRVDGVPLIDAAVVTMTCEVVGEHAAGDHVIVLCRVRSMGGDSSTDALLFRGGGYGAMV